MFKRNPAVFVWLAVILFAGYYFFTLYQFISKSYYVEEDQLYPLGTFLLLNRAHSQLEDYGRGSYSRRKLVFQSKNYYSFAIDGNVFRAITNEKKLKDTLMYAGLPFKVYTDKEYFDKYIKAKEPIFIRVFQIEIGDEKYIDILKMNRLSRGDLLRQILFWPAVILSCWFALSNKINYPAKRRLIILCLAWLAIFIGLLAGT